MKNRYVLLADLPLILIAASGAYAVRFDWLFLERRPEFLWFALAALVIKPTTFFFLGMYRRYWRYASIQELMLVAIAVTAASVGMAVFVVLATLEGATPHGFSRVVLFVDWLLTLVMTGGLRLAIRVVHEPNIGRWNAGEGGKVRRVLIVGAGAAGTMVAREMRRNRQLGMEAVGFLDDDAGKHRKHMAGLEVLGDTQMLAYVVRAKRIDSVVIAMPTAPGRVVRAILDMCNQAGVASQTIPGVFELLDGQVSVNRLRKVDIADLLRRSPIDGRHDAAAFVAGRVVLITGGGGSIGSELARQIANAGPAHLVLLGHGENSIFEAEARLRAGFARIQLSTVIADIRDDARLARVFDRFRPAIVFHAAAHKHVPLMEENPEEAVTNNITGTRNVVCQALRTGVERFVLISTDKAVEPASVMGATKRVAEAIVRKTGQTSGHAFVVVRFGNVLGSRGSVVNTFKDQIERGGPVTVTHPEMTRYFMTIPEAVHLVLQASGMGKGGELFVLDMGEPIKIVDLARDLIRLSGLHEEDVPILFTGVRPGEKFKESLCGAGRTTRPTPHPEVLEILGAEKCTQHDLDTVISQLEDAARRGDRAALNGILRGAVYEAVSGVNTHSSDANVVELRPRAHTKGAHSEHSGNP